jgi:DNA replication protein DnaC
MLRDDHDRALRLRTAKEAALLSDRFKSVGIGLRYQHCVWSDYKLVVPAAGSAVDACREYAAGDSLDVGRNLLLLGAPGTGKNMLAALVCKDLVAGGRVVLHTTVAKLVRRIRDSWRGGTFGDGETAAFEIFTTPDLLVLDEIGVQRGSEDEARIVFDVLNDRYDAMKSTVLISNERLSDIESYLGKRTMSRILEQHVLVPFTWADYRCRP